MTTQKRVTKLTILLVFALIALLNANPGPGDIFREYMWTGSPFLRVGGSEGYGGNNITWPGVVDLKDAVKAEVNVQKLLCHPATRGLRIAVNDNDWIKVPISNNIPEPQSYYQHMIYPNIPVPLSQLIKGVNAFKMTVDATCDLPCWPQNLIYGVMLRVYYAKTKPHARAVIVEPLKDAWIGDKTLVKALPEKDEDVKKIEFLGYYEGFNYEGDGNYRQWHYHFLGQYLKQHIGTTTFKPWGKYWTTSWIPDQTEPMKICARVTDKKGMVYMTPAVGGLRFVSRGKYSVKMYKPDSMPQWWSTRYGLKKERFKIPTTDPLDKIKAGKLVWVSWSGGYNKGLYINNEKIMEKATYKNYSYDFNDVPFTPDMLKHGNNHLWTLATPQNHHGMEVNWPGIVVFVKYDAPGTSVKPVRKGERKAVSVAVQQNMGGIRFLFPSDVNALRSPQILNCLGQSVRDLPVDAGTDLFWDGYSNQGYRVSPGLYFLSIPGQHQTIRFMKLD